MMHIEVIGQYEVVLEAYPTLSSAAWTSYLTIYRGRAAGYKSILVLQRQAVAGAQEFRSKEQAIEMARFYAARKIAKGKF